MTDPTDAGAGRVDRWRRWRSRVTMSDRIKAAMIGRKHGIHVNPEDVARAREFQERLARGPIRRTW